MNGRRSVFVMHWRTEGAVGQTEAPPHLWQKVSMPYFMPSVLMNDSEGRMKKMWMASVNLQSDWRDPAELSQDPEDVWERTPVVHGAR